MNTQQRIADQNADKLRDQFWALLRKDRANRLATLVEKKTRRGMHREVRKFLLSMDPEVLLTMAERNCSLSWAERRVNKGGPRKAMEEYFFAALDYGRLCTGN
jgi:hypothetical protein